MPCFFGVYFGNTNMCLAMHKDSKTEVLANAAGYRVTPSVIAFLNDSEKVVGLDAKQVMHKNPENAVTNIKELLKNMEKEVDEKDVTDQPKVNGRSQNSGKSGSISNLGVLDFLTIIFSNMKDIASSHSHEDVCPAVVTVPYYFNECQKHIVREAIVKSGFKLLRIVSECAAAAFAYNLGQESNDSSSNCMVFRMGGSSLDVSILQVSYGMYSVVSSVSRNEFGGNLITDCIANFCASEFQRQYKVDVRESKRSVMKLRNAAEQYKHVVYGSTNERCQVESLYDGIDLNIPISKARFDSLTHSLLLKCLDPVQEALKSANLSESEIKTVILSGGSCKIPKLQQLISNKFSSANVLYSICPDEVIAVGAAKQAVLVSHKVDEENCYINLLSQDISIKLTGFSAAPEDLLICAKGTLIPTVITESFSVQEDSKLRMELYEGRDSATEEKTLIAVMNMPNLPAGDIYFSFHIRSDGSVYVSCKDFTSKELGSATIVPPHSQTCT